MSVTRAKAQSVTRIYDVLTVLPACHSRVRLAKDIRIALYTVGSHRPRTRLDMAGKLNQQ